MSMRNQVLTLCNGIGNICNVLVTQFLTDLSDVMLLFKQVLCRDNSVVLEKVKSILQARFPIGKQQNNLVFYKYEGIKLNEDFVRKQ